MGLKVDTSMLYKIRFAATFDPKNIVEDTGLAKSYYATRYVKAIIKPGLTPMNQNEWTLHIELLESRKQPRRRAAKKGAQRRRVPDSGPASIVLRLDPDVLQWFGSGEQRYEVLINSLSHADMAALRRSR
jgi:hypothetical protein